MELYKYTKSELETYFDVGMLDFIKKSIKKFNQFGMALSFLSKSMTGFQ
jgi:hypothetical protein